MRRLKNRKGFTFIELVVVMAILAILSAIAITYYHDIMKSSYDLTAKADARSLITALHGAFFDESLVVDFAASASDSVIGEPVIFTFSPGVKARLVTGFKSPLGSGDFYAEIYHYNGTPGIDYTIEIDEELDYFEAQF